MKRKILSVFLVFSILFSISLSGNMNAFGAEIDLNYDFDGIECTRDKSAAGNIDYILEKYRNGSVYTGKGECWGYAEKVSNFLSKTRSVKYYTALKFNKNNFREKCMNAKAGTHIRISNHKSFNGASGHSIVLFRVTEDVVYWGDNNYFLSNHVLYYKATLADFVDCYSQYKYINMVAKTTKYDISETPQTVSRASFKNQNVSLIWTPVRGATRYDIYRASSSKQNFKKVASTNQNSYVDVKIKPGDKKYYKIKAIKEGKDPFGNIVSRTMRLATPIPLEGYDEITGKSKIHWKPVKGADRYIVYRNVLNGKDKYLATTTKCEYLDKKFDDLDGATAYKVKAIYDKNPKGNSALSGIAIGWVRLPQPLITEAYRLPDGSVQLSWEKDERACAYGIYVSEVGYTDYCMLDEVRGNSYIDKISETSEPLSYKIEALDKEGNTISAMSKAVEVK